MGSSHVSSLARVPKLNLSLIKRELKSPASLVHMKKAPRILFFVTEDWVFWSHRLSLAKAAKKDGYEVQVVTRVHEHKDLIEKEGFKLIPLNMGRGSTNLLRELFTIIEVIKIYRREKPDLVHHVAVKPVLYGTLAARFSLRPAVINLLTGFTRTFHKIKWKSALIEKTVMLAYRLAYWGMNPVTVFQNQSDMQIFLDHKILKRKNAEIIKGSGVDTQHFFERLEPEGKPVVVLASRMLWEKGIKEFVEAAEWLHRNDVECRMVLVGDADLESPKSVTPEILDEWKSKGIVEWWGHEDNMPKVFSKANIVCLPSYHEGAPKVLLEAASSGIAIVATDIPGCGQIARQDENGLLVPVKDSIRLAEAIKFLVENPKIRKEMGARGRKLVLEEFSDKIIIKKYLSLYKRVVG